MRRSVLYGELARRTRRRQRSPISPMPSSSLVHRLLFAVLERMGLLGRSGRLIRSMHAANSTLFEVSACAVAEVAVSSVLKGRTVSGSLFAVALDPMIRRFTAQRMLATATIFAHHDELAAILWRLRQQLSVILEIMACWSGVSG